MNEDLDINTLIAKASDLVNSGMIKFAVCGEIPVQEFTSKDGRKLYLSLRLSDKSIDEGHNFTTYEGAD